MTGRKRLVRIGKRPVLIAAFALLLVPVALLAQAPGVVAAAAGQQGASLEQGFFLEHRVALGWQSGLQDPFSGVSFKKAIDQYSAVQAISQLQLSPDQYHFALGVRYLRDLGKKLFVHRYYGVGIGYSMQYTKPYSYPGDQPYRNNVAAAQAFIGIEVPWSFWQLVSALSSSVELSVGAQYDAMGLQAQYGAGLGLHYWF